MVEVPKDAQPIQRQPGSSDLNGGGLLCDDLRQSPGGDDLHIGTQFGAEALDHALDHADIAEEQAGLHGMGGIATDDGGWSLQIDALQLGGMGEEGLSGEVEVAFARLLAIMENYPVLRSVEVVTNLMDELAGTENRISVERRNYNDLVRDYNTAIKTFPRNMLASMFGFTSHEYFESVSGADQVPKVEF